MYDSEHSDSSNFSFLDESDLDPTYKPPDGSDEDDEKNLAESNDASKDLFVVSIPFLSILASLLFFLPLISYSYSTLCEEDKGDFRGERWQALSKKR